MPVCSSPKLEMFSLYTWVQNINLENTIIQHIDDITEPKRSFRNDYLKYKCDTLIAEKYNDCYKIYTDGSKTENGMGAAVFDPQSDTKLKFKIDTNVSIMYAELFALSEALSYISSVSYNKFVIMTDARSALQHLARCTSSIRGLPIAYLMLEKIHQLDRSNKKSLHTMDPLPRGCEW